MKLTNRQLRRIIREAIDTSEMPERRGPGGEKQTHPPWPEIESEDPEVVRAAEAIAAAIDGANIKTGAAAWAFDDVISDALSDFDTDKDFLLALENHFRANRKSELYSDRAVWAGPAYIGSKIAWSTPGFADARRYADMYGS